MGFFDIFKKGNKQGTATSDNGIAGPFFLDGLTEPVINPNGLYAHEWRRQLKTSAGQTQFMIRYYGQLHHEHTSLIVGTEQAPALVLAVDKSTGKEIVLFDGCRHGYNALLCDTYTEAQVNNRPATQVYADKEGNDSFAITISAFYGIDYDEEFSADVDSNGMIELVNGSKIPFENLKRNGFDALQIKVTNASGKSFNIVLEELS